MLTHDVSAAPVERAVARQLAVGLHGRVQGGVGRALAVPHVVDHLAPAGVRHRAARRHERRAGARTRRSSSACVEIAQEAPVQNAVPRAGIGISSSLFVLRILAILFHRMLTWPSGLRRQTQVLVGVSPRGFSPTVSRSFPFGVIFIIRAYYCYYITNSDGTRRHYHFRSVTIFPPFGSILSTGSRLSLAP